MSLSLLLLLLVGSCQATHFLGTVMTYYPKNTYSNGSVQVVVRYKSNFHSCQRLGWSCRSGVCGTESLTATTVDKEDTNSEWCQTEGKSTRLVPSNAPFQLSVNSGNWISNIKNGIISWRAVTTVELRNRSDAGRANTSPQTTIIPAVRVPSNCQRDFNLLVFDPDGDEVRCRYGSTALFECNPCTPPIVLSLSPSCTLSFSPTISSNEGPYAVQLVMEDFPRQDINLTHTDGSQEVKITNDTISKIPVQFVLRVDPVAPSCTDGVYLPRFLSPTPAHGAQLYAPVGQSLEISIRAEASSSNVVELLFSGPSTMSESTPATGEYILSWTPFADEDGESHPVCFVVQSNTTDNRKYHSDLRCVLVTVGEAPSTTAATTTTTPTTTTTTPTTTTTTPTTTTPTTTTTTPTTATTTPTTTTTTPTTTTTTPTTTTPTTTTTTPTTTTTTTTPTTTTTTPTTTTTTPTTTTTTPPATTTGSAPVNSTDQIVLSLRIRITTSIPLSDDGIRNTVIQQLKEELVKRGLPADSTLRLLSSSSLNTTLT